MWVMVTQQNCESPCRIIFSHAFNESDKRRNEPNFAILSLCFNKCGTKEKDKACVAEKQD